VTTAASPAAMNGSCWTSLVHAAAYPAHCAAGAAGRVSADAGDASVVSTFNQRAFPSTRFRPA